MTTRPTDNGTTVPNNAYETPIWLESHVLISTPKLEPSVEDLFRVLVLRWQPSTMCGVEIMQI